MASRCGTAGTAGYAAVSVLAAAGHQSGTNEVVFIAVAAAAALAWIFGRRRRVKVKAHTRKAPRRRWHW